jgi:hypothetical protein
MRICISYQDVFKALDRTYFQQRDCRPVGVFVLKFGRAEVYLIATEQEAKAAKLPMEKAETCMGLTEADKKTWQAYKEDMAKIALSPKNKLKLKALDHWAGYEKACKKLKAMEGGAPEDNAAGSGKLETNEN